MKKVIVMDDPKTCRKCMVFRDYCGVKICKAAHKKFTDSAITLLCKSDSYKPPWCPAKDLPEHKLDWRAGENGYESGWNDVLDLIGGVE